MAAQYIDFLEEEEEYLVGEEEEVVALTSEVDLGIPISNPSPEMLSKISNSESQLLKLDHRGLPVITVAPVEHSPKAKRLTPHSSDFGTCRESSSHSTEDYKSCDDTEGDQDLNAAIQGLQLEWQKGILVTPEVLQHLDLISSSRHGSQMHNLAATIRSIESRAGPFKKQLAVILSNSCRWGIKSMLGCLAGTEAPLLCVTSAQSNNLQAGSDIIDNMAIREKEAENRARAHQSLNEITRVQNEHLDTFSKLVTLMETLLLTMQNLHNKVAAIPPSALRSLSSIKEKASKIIETITEAGMYQCTFGTLQLKEGVTLNK